MAADRGDGAGAAVRIAGMSRGVRLPAIPALAMYAIALACLAGAVFLGGRAAEFMRSAASIEAEVVRMAGNEDEEGATRTRSWPILRWLDASREPVEWQGPTEKGAPTFGVGDRVRLLVDLNGQPRRVEIDAFASVWSGTLVCLAGVWLFGGIGLLVQRMDSDKDDSVFAYAALFFGLPTMFGAAAAFAVDAHALSSGVHTTGYVLTARGVPWTLFKEGESQGSLPAVVRITASDGRVVELTDAGFNAVYADPEEKVQVVYPPGRPYAGRVVDGLEYWIAPIVLFLFALPFTAIGLFMLRAGTTRRRAGD